MKKFSVFLALTLVVSMLAGCAGTPVVYYADCTCPTEGAAETTPVTEATEGATEATEAVTAEGAVKTGLAILTGVSESKAATAEENGEAKYDVTLVAVTVDDNGVITSCAIDSVGTSVTFDATGVVTSDLSAEILSKNELGENYGMKAYAGAKYEWNEQAAAVAAFAVGKTVEDLKNGFVDETGHAADADLASTATIYIGGYVDGIIAAVENAKHLGAQAGDALKLACVSSVGKSAAATAEKAGNAQLDTTVTALTVKDGVITSCYIDAVQAKVGFDTAGALTTDTTAPVQTKNELGENYGMVAWGGAIAEWDAQAAAFASYVTGKTAAEIAGIAVTETTAPAEADLAASVTISIGDFQALIAKAAAGSETVGAEAVKTGLAIVTGVSESKAATAEENGEAKYDVTLVAVTVDDNGVITSCAIDSVGTSVTFDATGAVTSDLSAEILSKNELGENYGMKAYAGAKYEWNEQAAAVAAFAVGKTVEDLKNGFVDETGHAADADLASTATIYIGGYVDGIIAAVENAKHLGAQAGDALKLACVSSVGKSAAATAEKAGNAQLDTTVTALTVKDGVITSCYIDAVQAKVGFDTAGALTTDTAAPVQTKNELGENYGMVAWGGAIAEWDAQAAAFASYVTGKTAAEIAGIAVTETTAPAEADLAASVTISIGDFQALIEKALQ